MREPGHPLRDGKKICRVCSVDQDASNFSKRTASQDGLQDKCKTCAQRMCVKHRHARLMQNPNHDHEVGRRYYEKNRAHRIADVKRYQAQTGYHWRSLRPAKAKDLAEHTSLLRRFSIHGLTLDQYHSFAEKQDFRCAICGVVPNDNYGGSHDGFHIDHDHVTKKVRGLLCKHCNVGIGMMKDSEEILQSAIRYLRRSQAADSPSVSQAPCQNPLL